MGYKIQYGPPIGAEKKRERAYMGWVILLGVMILLVGVNILGFGKDLFHFLLPGDRAVTAAALEQLEDRILEGVSIAESFAEFCRDVIRGAGLDSLY